MKSFHIIQHVVVGIVGMGGGGGLDIAGVMGRLYMDTPWGEPNTYTIQ